MRHILLPVAAVLACATAARADDYPARKPGLWVITMNNERMAGHTMRMCIDAATDGLMRNMGQGAMGAKCGQRSVHRSGDVLTIDTSCQMGASQMSSHGVITLNGDTGYTGDITTHFNPPMMGRAESHTTQVAKWSGACPADMKPGDVITPMGKMNVLTMQHMMPH